ncbi:uncharacterized protein LOC143923177 [Arctopsyche grandis]|uniref:uncharacterized protein LOC143923177 n=1 Tax=Arctopsyche grandis TaxID=121162 RepID=UPI00406D8E85
MECRLCLRFTPPESSVSIHDGPHPLVRRILTCCQLQIERDDCLSNTICIPCKNNLELLSTFRNTCIQSDESQKLRLARYLNVKKEEIILDDLVWDDEIGSSVKDKGDEQKLCALRKCLANKSYKCDICSKSLGSKYNLDEHLKSHHGIKSHEKSHTKTNPYKCDVCTRSFSRKFNLAGHLKLHSGEGLYKCDTCLKGFAFRYDMIRHLKCHTKKTPAKSVVERVREYRARKKALRANAAPTNRGKGTAKSAVERMREYRARKKAAKSHSKKLHNLNTTYAEYIPP